MELLDCIFFLIYYILKLFIVYFFLVLICMCYFIFKQSKIIIEILYVDGVVVSGNIKVKISILIVFEW